MFKTPHLVRQRRSVAQMLCTVCGEPTVANDRWWFRHGEPRKEGWMTTEAPVHRACAEEALGLCPHLAGSEGHLERFPGGHSVMAAIVGGEECERDFGVMIGGRVVVGHLKLVWPDRPLPKMYRARSISVEGGVHD